MPTDAISIRPPSCPTATFPQTDRHVRLPQTAIKGSSEPACTYPLPDISILESYPTREFGFDMRFRDCPYGLRELGRENDDERQQFWMTGVSGWAHSWGKNSMLLL